MEALKSPLSAALNAFFPNSSRAGITLREGESEKLTTADGEAASCKVEFRVEGMTCGACVEVRPPVHSRYAQTS